MLSETIKSRLTERFNTPLPEFQKCRSANGLDNGVNRNYELFADILAKI